MNAPSITLVKRPAADHALANPLLWLVFLVYIIVLGYASAHHQMWWDEINAWNLAKASNSFSDLLTNIRYEGHPPAWHTILWLISKCTNNLMYVQVVHATIASLAVFTVLFFAPFPFITRVLIPFGYYFLFEYAVIDRDYAIGVLAAVCICVILRKEFKYKLLLYYALLFFIASTHLLGMLLGAALHLYFLALTMEKGKKKSTLVLHILAGMAVVLPLFYLILPPSDNGLFTYYWTSSKVSAKIAATLTSPVRAFIPVPAWWKYNCWNTQFLLEARNDYPILRFFNHLVSAGLMVLVFFILRKSKKSLLLFIANLFFSAILSIAVITLTTGRYAGFLFIGFITAYWLYCYEITPVRAVSRAVNILLVIQIIAGIYFISISIVRPFSNLYRVNELIKEVPAGDSLVTDYGAMNAIEAYVGKPAYCVDLQKELSFAVWNNEVAAVETSRDRYSVGFRVLFQRTGLRKAYMVTRSSTEMLLMADSLLFRSFPVQLVDKREGAIEKGGNLYLYLISKP